MDDNQILVVYIAEECTILWVWLCSIGIGNDYVALALVMRKCLPFLIIDANSSID